FSGGPGPEGTTPAAPPPGTTAEPKERLHLVRWGLRRRQSRDPTVGKRRGRGEGGRGRGHRRWRCRLLELLAQGGLAALSQGVVSFEVEDRAAQTGDELGKVDGFGVAVANSALPLDHPRE